VLVIFACLHNAGRSQMARAFFNALVSTAGVSATSAGTEPAPRIHPSVVEAMAEIGMDIASSRPQRLTDELANRGSLLVTMGCGDRCPIVPGLERLDWSVPDPKDMPIGEVRAIRDDIRQRVIGLIESRGWNRASR
jgi:arsenate reductase